MDKTTRHKSARPESRHAARKLPTRRESTLELRDSARRSASRHAQEIEQRKRREPQGDAAEAQQSVRGMLLLVNDISGASILAPSEALRHEPPDNPDPVKVVEAVKQVEAHVHVFPEDKSRLLSDFQTYVKREQALYCCASCGVRDIEQQYTELTYTRALHESGCLLLPQHVVDLRGKLNAVQLEPLNRKGEPLGVYEERQLQVSQLGTRLCNGYEFEEAGSGGEVSWLGLHADHVERHALEEGDDDVPQAAGSELKLKFHCCGSCSASLHKLETPKFGLSNGVDFGRLESAAMQTFLPQLSDIEKLALAPVRTYGLVAKVVTPDSRATAAQVARSQLKGHMISFMQDALPVVLNASTELQLDALTQLKTLPQAVRVFLVGPEGVHDVLASRLKKCPNMQLRPRVVWNALTILHALSQHLGEIKEEMVRQSTGAWDEEIRRAEAEEEDPQVDEERAKAAKHVESALRSLPRIVSAVPSLEQIDQACAAALSEIDRATRRTTDMRADNLARVRSSDVALVRDPGGTGDGTSPEEGGAPECTGGGTSSSCGGCFKGLRPSQLEGCPLVANGAPGMLVEKVAVLDKARGNGLQTDARNVEAICAATTAPEAGARLPRGNLPISDFSDNDHLISGSFWWLFPLGGGWLSRGSQPRATVRHILLQGDARAARDVDFVLLLTNQKVRHTGAGAVNSRMRSSPAAYKAYRDVVDNPGFTELSEAAKASPSGPEGKLLQQKVLPFLHLCEKAVAWSSAERKSCISDLWALARRYGTPSVFWTIAFDDVHDPRVLRLSFRAVTNRQQTDEHLEALTKALFSGSAKWRHIDKERVLPEEEGEEGEERGFEVPLNELFMQRAAAANPVATSMVYDRLLRGVMAVLLGTPSADADRVTRPLRERIKGLFGTGLASYVVTEVTGRLAKHAHGLFWGGAFPAMLSNFAHFEDLMRKHILPALQSQASTSFPTAFHVADAARHSIEQGRGRKMDPFMPMAPINAACLPPDSWEEHRDARAVTRLGLSPSESASTAAADLTMANEQRDAAKRFEHALGSAALRCAGRCNSHTWHHPTCRKGAHGAERCRMGFSCGHPTPHSILQLLAKEDDKKEPPPRDVIPPSEYVCASATCDSSGYRKYHAVKPRAPTSSYHRGICAPPFVPPAVAPGSRRTATPGSRRTATPRSAANPGPSEPEFGELWEHGEWEQLAIDAEEAEAAAGEVAAMVEDSDADEGASKSTPVLCMQPLTSGGGPRLGQLASDVVDKEQAELARLEGGAAPGTPAVQRKTKRARPPPAWPTPPDSDGPPSRRTRSASRPTPSGGTGTQQVLGTPQRGGMGAAARAQERGPTAQAPRRRSCTYADPLIPLPDDRLLALELPRPGTLDPSMLGAEEAALYETKVLQLLCASLGKGSRVERPTDIDGARALAVVHEVFETASVKELLNEAAETSDELRGAIGAIGRAVEDMSMPEASVKEQQRVAQRIVFAWRRLPCRNAQVAAYNDVLCCLLGCNNNPVHLGADVAAKAAMFYLVKYVTKDSTELNTALSVLVDANQHVDKWKSSADDVETNPNRRSIHLAERVSNTNGAMELSDTQGAGCVLGHRAHLSSELYAHVGMDGLTSLGAALCGAAAPSTDGQQPSTRAVLDKLERDGIDYLSGDPPEIAADDDDDESDEGHESDSGDGEARTDDDEAAPRDPAQDNMDEPKRKRRQLNPESASGADFVQFFKVPVEDGTEKKEKKVPVDPAMHYLWRGKALARLNHLELHACFELEEMASDKYEAAAAEEEAARLQPRPAAGEPSRGRRPHVRVLFHRDHQLHSSWRWMARARLRVPKVGGRKPPKPPPQLGPEEAVPRVWLKQQRIYAEFMVANFVPWFSGTPEEDEPFLLQLEHNGPRPGPPPLTVEVLRAWIAHLQALAWPAPGAPSDDEEAQIAQGRLRYMQNFVCGLGSGSVERMLSLQHKFRNADEHSEAEKQAAKHDASAEKMGKKTLENLQAQFEGRPFDAAKVERARATRQATQLITDGIAGMKRPANVDTSAVGATVPVPELARASDITAVASTQVGKASAEKAAKLKAITAPALPQLAALPPAAAAAAAGSAADEHEAPVPAEFAVIDDDVLEAATEAWRQLKEANDAQQQPTPQHPPLQQDQRTFCRRLMPYLWAVRKAKQQGEPRHLYFPRLCKQHGPPLHLLLGMGGTGKTEMLKVLEHVLLREGIGRVVFLAYMGVAAALLPHGYTMCTGLDLHPNALSSDNLETAACAPDTRTKLNKLHGDESEIVLIVLDEVSFLTAPNVLHTSDRVAQWLELPVRGADLPFGGVPAVMQGHFFQLPPVSLQGRPLYASVVHHFLSKVPRLGKDPAKTKPPRARSAELAAVQILVRAQRFDLTKQMRAAKDRQHREFAEELCRTDVTFPVTPKYLSWLESRQLTDRSDPDLAFAPHGVVTHADKDLLSLHLLREFARHHNRPLMRWAIELPESVFAFHAKGTIDGLYVHDEAVMYDYFVEGVPMIVLENVATPGGCANGTRCIGRSLTLDEVDKRNAPNVEVLPDGTVVVTLRKTPRQVNVELSTAHSQASHLDLLNQMGATHRGTGTVISIEASSKGYDRKLNFSSPFAAEHGFPQRVTVINKSVLPIMTDLVNTNYKYQGVTIPKYFVINLRKAPGRGNQGVRAPPSTQRACVAVRTHTTQRPCAPSLLRFGPLIFMHTSHLLVWCGALQASVQTVYVFHSRVKLGDSLFVLPGSGDLKYLLERQLPVELRIFEMSFDDEGYLNEQLMATAAERIGELDRKSLAARRKAESIARGGSKRARGRAGGAQPPVTSRPPPVRGKRSTAAAPPLGGPAPKRQSLPPPPGAGRRVAAAGPAAAPAAAAAAAAKGEKQAPQGQDTPELRVSIWQSVTWFRNSCGFDVECEKRFAVTLRLHALWRSTGGAAGPALTSAAPPKGLFSESDAANAAWKFVQERWTVFNGDATTKRAALRAMNESRDTMRAELVSEMQAESIPCSETSCSNAEENMRRLTPLAQETGCLWLAVRLQKSCGCGEVPTRRQRNRHRFDVLNTLPSSKHLVACDGDVFEAFTSLLACEWTPCPECEQMGATSVAAMHGYNPTAAPGGWCTAELAPPLLAIALATSHTGPKPAVVHRNRVRVLRLPNGTPVYYRPIALTYLGSGHYICDVDEAKADTTELPKWVRYDHMDKVGAGVTQGCGVPLAAVSIRKGDDRLTWKEKGQYRLSSVVYIRVELAETLATPPAGTSGVGGVGGGGKPGFRHVAALQAQLQAIRPAAERLHGRDPRASIEQQNAGLIAELRSALNSLEDDDAAAAALPATFPHTALYATEAHPVAVLQCVAQRAGGADGGGHRRAALVSCGNPAMPAPRLGHGHHGAEEELCRLMPLLREQLQRLRYPLAPGVVHMTRTLIRRSVFTYEKLAAPEVAWVLTMGVPDMRAAEWEGQELSKAWHLEVRKSVRAVFQAARDAHVTDLILSNDGCSELANPAAAYFGTVCDVLCSEFAGAFETVGFAIRAGEHAHLAACRKAVARLLLDAPPPSREEAGLLADHLDEWLHEHCGWEDTQGVPVSVCDVAAAAAHTSSLALGDARGLAHAAAELHRRGRLDLYVQSGTTHQGVCRGVQSAGPGLSAHVPRYTALQPRSGGEAVRCCEVLGIGAQCLHDKDSPCREAIVTVHSGGVQALAREVSESLRLPSGKVAILVAANSGRPGGSCRDHGGLSRGVHAEHKTQEEDVVSSWLACMPCGEGREAEFNRISNAWGLLDATGTGTQTKQGIDYTVAGVSPQVYADAWLLGSAAAPVPISTKRNNGAFCTDAADRLNVMLIFCAAPNASRPRAYAKESSSMKRTFCAAAADGRDFFECGRAWAVHAALCAARDAGAAIVVMPYVGGGLYAGPHNMEPDLKRRFVQSVNDMLRPVSGTCEGRMPCGTRVDALGCHFKAVHIVGLQ